ncbi:ATP-binding cassette domain-containing protein [Micromonospora sp. NBC_01796]|uniref:ATP-binding cassette domain-containing protein n=1 Tax=Micromonospora sp. NBC_01796 TaxID=2975987 RepID=UPI002DDB044F|nr:ATP-binding cassette domain-containing protein [Micromonospora sp. NBC_01796]WSA86743.1 ATP-binding cassette domain-containing protein [Micromonospora sp. NBC_01796]
MITLTGLTKRFGDSTAVDHLTLDIAPGRVTGFLGPNGAGKSTTMRMILGLDRPTAGTALVDGRPYASLRHPLRHVGALLDAKAVHPGRTARAHLLAMAHSNGIPARRVDEVLATVGLTGVAGKRAGTFSLGMGQRLGIAGALLGDPGVLMFDEPVNGLDPDGVRWIRQLMRSLAAEGRTVFVSSHLMSEMQLTADQLVVIGRGRLIVDAPIAEVIAGSSRTVVRVRSPQPAGLAALRDRLTAPTVTVEPGDAGELLISGADVALVGDLAHELGVRLHELSTREASLEQAYLELTADSLEYTGPASGPDRQERA